MNLLQRLRNWADDSGVSTRHLKDMRVGALNAGYVVGKSSIWI